MTDSHADDKYRKLAEELKRENEWHQEFAGKCMIFLVGKNVGDLRELKTYWLEEKKRNRYLDEKTMLKRRQAEVWIEVIEKTLTGELIAPATANSKSALSVNPENMSAEEAAAYLGIAKSTLYKMTSRNEIPFHKIGKRKLSFIRTELDDYIKSHRNKSNAEMDQQAESYLSKRLGRQQTARKKLP